MKNTRKFLGAALALSLAVGMTTTAMAAEYTVTKGDSLWKIAQKELASANNDAAGFTAAMKEAFPNYVGENYLDMTAGYLFP